MAHDVFISHSSKDKTIADAACACLESRGIRCWVAPRDIVAGVDWGSSIIDGINGTKVMVLILSSHSNVSKQVLREIERAAHRGMPVLPLRVEDVTLSKSLEYFLSSSHWLDAYKGPLKQHLENLANNTAILLEKREAVQEAAPGTAEGGPSGLTQIGWKGVPIWVLAVGALCLALAMPFYSSHVYNALKLKMGVDSHEQPRELTNPIAAHAGPAHGLTAGTTTSAATIDKRRLAVLPFKPLSAETADTSGYEEGIARILETPLASSPDFELVERADIDKVIRELQLTRDRQFDQSTAARIGRLVGAQQLLLGSYFKIGKTLRIDARIVDTETGRILTSVAREGDPENLTALVTTIGEELATSTKRVSK